MKHYCVFPLHDTNGRMVELLRKIRPELKVIFDKVFISVTPATDREKIEEFEKDPFFGFNFNKEDGGVGDHFMSGIKAASDAAEDEDIIHICTVDRLSFEIEYFWEEFKADIEQEKKAETPILYVRSEKAWRTHPVNYRAIETVATELCKRLYGKPVDLFWCDLAVKNIVLKKIIPEIKTHDLRFLVELLLPIIKELGIKEVDWLSWEDPYVFQKK